MTQNDQTIVHQASLIGGILLLFAIVVGLLYVSIDLLPLVFGAMLLAVFLNVLAEKMTRIFPTSMSRSVRVGIVVGLVIVLSGAVTFAFANSIGEQTVKLADRVDQSVDEVIQAAKKQPLLERLSDDKTKLRSLLPTSEKSLGMATNLFASAFGGLTDVLILFILTAYFCFGPYQYRDGAIRLFPVRWRDTLRSLSSESADTLWRWMIGRLLSMLIVGLLFGIGLSIIGVPLSIELGVFAGLVSFIPNIGAIAAVVPALLLASQQGTSSMISVLVLYAIIQFIESYLITPMIQQHQVAMPPALVILSQIVAGLVFGFWGVVFATPLFALVLLWVKRLYVQGYLEAST